MLLMMPGQTIISGEVLSAALAGLELQRNEIDEHVAQARGMLGRRGPGRPPKEATVEIAGRVTTTRRKGRRRFSAEARARMAEAQRKRRAAAKDAERAQTAPVANKRHLRVEARKKMAEAARKRWAGRKAKKTAA